MTLSSPPQKEADKYEKQVTDLGLQKKDLEEILADPDLYQDQEKFSKKSKEYHSIDRKLERALNKWEEAQSQIDKAEAELGQNDQP